jgi:NADH-quinone oxidoreductase subunit C
LADTSTAEATEAAPVRRAAHEVVVARLQSELGDAFVDVADAHGDLVVRVKREAWRRTAQIAKRDLGCDYLSFVAGMDWMPAPVIAEEGSGDTSAPVQPREMTFGVTGSDGRFQLLAHVESTHQHYGFTLKTDLDENDPVVESWVPVYAGADWHERECYEMYGFRFEGHPGLRKLYLPHEFEGHPARKDFPLLAREVKPWPGLVDVEPMPGEAPGADDEATEAAAE